MKEAKQDSTGKSPWRDLLPSDVPSSLTLDKETARSLRTPILDIGCGNGRLLARLGHAQHPSVGVDINEGLLVGRGKARSSLVVGDARRLPFLPGVFRSVTLIATLTVISDRSSRLAVLQEAERVLSRDGAVILRDFMRTWNSAYYRERYLAGLDETGELGTFPAKTSMEHSYLAHHFTQTEIESVLARSGLCLHDFRLEEVMTQSGRRIQGFTAIAKKTA